MCRMMHLFMAQIHPQLDRGTTEDSRNGSTEDSKNVSYFRQQYDPLSEKYELTYPS